MKQIVFFCPGGSKPNMTARVLALRDLVLKLHKIENGDKNGDNVIFPESNETFILAGFKNEILFMREEFNMNKEMTPGALSYDTVSNIRRRLKLLEESSEIHVATGPRHWSTICMIVEKKFPQLQGKFVWKDSGEKEGLTSKIREAMYKLLGPTVMEALAILLRPWKYWTQYRLPMIWDNFCLYILHVDPIDCVE